MRILMLAPEPFFEPRGTPISVYFRLQALSSLGHEVTLLTYHLGADVAFPGLRIKRIPDLWRIKKVKIGPSLTKIPLDLLLVSLAKWELWRRRYDLIFSHEEAAFFGVILARLWGIPHLYDMHSSLPQQLRNFRFTNSRLLIRLFQFLEKMVLKRSAAVIVICQDLEQQVAREGLATKAVLIENFLDFPGKEPSVEEIQQLRSTYASPQQKIVLYTGNFEPYQGISLLLEAARASPPEAVFLLVGGTPAEITTWSDAIEKMGLQNRVRLVPRVPPDQVHLFIAAADVLVSPRVGGTNTPLKIYTYLRSGKPLVATNLWTHTQAVRPEWAILTEPDPEKMAQAISFSLSSPDALARAIRAKEYASAVFTEDNYRTKIEQALSLARKQA